MNKQIEEMAKLACTVFDGNCKGCSFDFYPPCPPKASAERIYNAGFRKSTDVAREIFAEIERLLYDYSHEAYYQGEEFVEGFIEREFEDTLAELKKKYESEGADDEN